MARGFGRAQGKGVAVMVVAKRAASLCYYSCFRDQMEEESEHPSQTGYALTPLSRQANRLRYRIMFLVAVDMILLLALYDMANIHRRCRPLDDWSKCRRKR